MPGRTGPRTSLSFDDSLRGGYQDDFFPSQAHFTIGGCLSNEVGSKPSTWRRKSQQAGDATFAVLSADRMNRGAHGGVVRPTGFEYQQDGGVTCLNEIVHALALGFCRERLVIGKPGSIHHVTSGVPGMNRNLSPLRPPALARQPRDCFVASGKP